MTKPLSNYANGEDIKCLQTSILADFGETESNGVGHDCCLLCHENCHCNGSNRCGKQIPYMNI